jgi:hypothetical protein
MGGRDDDARGGRGRRDGDYGGGGIISEMCEAEVSRTRYGHRRLQIAAELGLEPTLSESVQEEGGEPADSFRRQNLLPCRISLPVLATSEVTLEGEGRGCLTSKSLPGGP